MNLTFGIVFSITDNGHTGVLPVWPSFGKNFQKIKTGTEPLNKLGIRVGFDFIMKLVTWNF
jgi:hypothetical protein